jgi:hypothetical protein
MTSFGLRLLGANCKHQAGKRTSRKGRKGREGMNLIDNACAKAKRGSS